MNGRAGFRSRRQVLGSWFLTRLYEPGTSPGEIAGRPAGYQVGTNLDPDADAETTYTFDQAGRLETVADQDASSFTYAYTPDSYHLPASLTGGPIAVTYTWEAEDSAEGVRPGSGPIC